MAVTHGSAVRDTLCNAAVDAVDASGGGDLVYLTSADAEVATLPMSSTAFGAASSGTATAAAITDDTDATGGTIAKFEIRNGAAAVIFAGSCSLTGGGGDIILSSLVIGAGDTVSCDSLTYSAPP
jgi:hypothetical protein